jgi:hypothetical protein
LAPILGFPALAVQGGFSATACRSDLNFSACHSPKELCSKRRMTSNSPQKFAGPGRYTGTAKMKILWAISATEPMRP